MTHVGSQRHKKKITKLYGRMDVRLIAPSIGQRWPVSFKPGHFTPDERTRSPIGQRAEWTPEPVWILLRRWKSLAHAVNQASTSRSPSRYPSNYTELTRLKSPLRVYWREISYKHHDRRSDVRCGKYGAVVTEDTRVIVTPHKPYFYFWYHHNENLHDELPPHSWHWIIFHLEFGFLTCCYCEDTERSAVDKGRDSPSDPAVSPYFCIV